MAVKITFTSEHPEFKPFGDWADEKIAQLEQSGNSAEAQKIKDAIAAKAAANTHVALHSSDIEVEGSVTKEASVQTEQTKQVPEFDVYFEQWQSQYNVQITSEEV
jgi:hypothetical protein